MGLDALVDSFSPQSEQRRNERVKPLPIGEVKSPSSTAPSDTCHGSPSIQRSHKNHITAYN